MSILDCQLQGAPPELPNRSHGLVRGNEYGVALEAMFPALRQLVGPAVAADDARLSHGSGKDKPASLMIQLSAAQALAVFAGETGRADATLRDQIRSALLRWQLSLLGDGRPIHSAHRDHGHRAACAGFVARILAGGVSYETPVIVADLTSHLSWLWSRARLAAWSEAALIGAACETALVARESAMLRRARERLKGLLNRQNEEGWFDDGRGCKLVEQAFTLDTLASVRIQTEWPELMQPLRRALAFASHSAGAPRGNLFPMSTIPFFAIEASAPDTEEARSLASFARRAASSRGALLREAAGEGDFSLVASSMSLAASSMSLAATVRDTRSDRSLAEGSAGQSSLSGGILVHRGGNYDAWIDMHSGAALSVCWRQSGLTVEDDLLIFSHGSVARSASSQRASQTCPPAKISYRGEIRRGEQVMLHELDGMRNRLAGMCVARKLGTHEREIVLDAEEITISDHVSLRRRADALVFGTADAGKPGQGSIVLGGVKEVELRRVYREGRLTEFQRNTR